ncbi:MAG: hypothetical protein GY871_13150, partial [Actinomycetales bacterium]|nr:hypothetical protein [Actinomycetales bacterium]
MQRDFQGVRAESAGPSARHPIGRPMTRQVAEPPVTMSSVETSISDASAASHGRNAETFLDHRRTAGKIDGSGNIGPLISTDRRRPHGVDGIGSDEPSDATGAPGAPGAADDSDEPDEPD